MKNVVFYVHVSHLAVYKHGTSEKMNIGQKAQFWCCVAHTNRIAILKKLQYLVHLLHQKKEVISNSCGAISPPIFRTL